MQITEVRQCWRTCSPRSCCAPWCEPCGVEGAAEMAEVEAGPEGLHALFCPVRLNCRPDRKRKEAIARRNRIMPSPWVLLLRSNSIPAVRWVL
jgi:hypothetical protein